MDGSDTSSATDMPPVQDVPGQSTLDPTTQATLFDAGQQVGSGIRSGVLDALTPYLPYIAIGAAVLVLLSIVKR